MNQSVLTESIVQAYNGVKLSITSKLGVKSWSLQAIKTCPGSVGKDGKLVDACSTCYATQGTYHYPNVIATRAYNQVAWEFDNFVPDFILALDNERYFRWFDSGDMYSIELAEKMLAIMIATPWVKHWLPTRMAKFPKFKAIIAKMQALDNVMVRFSSDSIDGEITEAHGSTIVQSKQDALDAGYFPCNAPENNGKCGPCRACYDKTIPVIAYLGHGAKMKKVIRLRSV